MPDRAARLAARECDWQLIVVDDGSSDETADAAAGSAPARSGRARAQRGFAAPATTARARPTSASTWSSSTTTPSRSPAGSTAWSEASRRSRRAAAVGAKLLFPNGTIQHAGLAITQDGLAAPPLRGLPGRHPAVNRTRRIAAVTGACMLVRPRDFERLGGFDEAFLNGYEDVDLCHRLHAAGREVGYCAESVLYHLESVTRWPARGPRGGRGRTMALYAERWASGSRPTTSTTTWRRPVSLEYGAYDPLQLSVSPQLAVVQRDGSRATARSSGPAGALPPGDGAAVGAHARGAERRRRPSRGPRPAAAQLDRGRARHAGRARAGSARGAPATWSRCCCRVKNQESRRSASCCPLMLRPEGCAPRSRSLRSTPARATARSRCCARCGATIVTHRPGRFNHGLTRNLAASTRSGDVLVFLSGRSRPVDERWLAPLLQTLDADPQSAGVCSRVLPRTRRRPADAGATASGSSAARPRASAKRSPTGRPTSACRGGAAGVPELPHRQRRDSSRRVRADPVPRGDTLGEDLLWAREVIEAGWSLVARARLAVYHSHHTRCASCSRGTSTTASPTRRSTAVRCARRSVVPMIRAMVADDWALPAGRAGARAASELEHGARSACCGAPPRSWASGSAPTTTSCQSPARDFSGVNRARRSR